MSTDWDFTALSFFDQLPQADQGRILAAVERLSSAPGTLEASRLTRLPTAEGDDEFLLRVGEDLRIVFQRGERGIRVIDVFRRSQLESRRELQAHS